VKREQGWIYAFAEPYQIFILYMILEEAGTNDREDIRKILDSFEVMSKKYEGDLCALFIVSAVAIEPHSADELAVRVSRAPGAKCQRCWNYTVEVGQSRDHPELCRRCEDVVRQLS
jgi:isoleucyl-tRNA synthetase